MNNFQEPEIRQKYQSEQALVLSRPLHRSWLRLLPYSAFGAFIFASLMNDYSSVFSSYFVIFGVQLLIITSYLLIRKIAKSNKSKNSLKLD